MDREELLTNGRPLFNEKAYKILVNQRARGSRAAASLQQATERAQDDPQGPAEDEQAYTDAFNEVFGGLKMSSGVSEAPLPPVDAQAVREPAAGGQAFGASHQYAGFIPAILLYGAVLRRPAWR